MAEDAGNVSDFAEAQREATRLMDINEWSSALITQYEASSVTLTDVQKEQLREQLKQTTSNVYQALVEKSSATSSYKTGLAYELGIHPGLIINLDFGDIDFTGKNPEMENFLQDIRVKLTKKIVDTQARNGESGQLKATGKTAQGMFKTLQKYMGWKKAIEILLIIGIGGGALTGAGFTIYEKFHSGKSINNYIQNIKGCVQYNVNTGQIQVYGNCGVSNIILDSKDNTCCGACSSSGACPSLLTSVSCKSDDDCYMTSNPKCSNGACQNPLTCDATNGCIPCPFPGPLGQYQSLSSLPLCTKNGVCPAATTICNPTKSGGACDQLQPTQDDQGKPTGWTTTTICGNGDDFVAGLQILNNYSSEWEAPNDPLLGKIITYISIGALVLTLLWYVIFLIRKVKNKRE